MELMSKEKADDILHFNGLDRAIVLRNRSDEFRRLSYWLPKKSSVQLILSERLHFALCQHDECWVYITDWNSGPTSMCYEIFYGYRTGRGDQRSLKEASVYQFLPEDAQYFMSLIMMILCFSWDAWIFDAGLTYLVNISNDDIIEYSTNSDDIKDKLTNEFSGLDMLSL